MANPVPNLLQERRYPFFFAITLIFLCGILFLFSTSNDISPMFSVSSPTFLRRTESQPNSSSSPSPIPSSQLPPQSSLPSTPPRQQISTIQYQQSSPPPPPLLSPPPPPLLSPPLPLPSLSVAPAVSPAEDRRNKSDDSGDAGDLKNLNWEVCKGPMAVDYIPCLDNAQAIKSLKSRKRMEHRERHCPLPSPRCLVPLPIGYKIPISWPKSRDMIWYNNVPHPKLVEYKKVQNWVRKSGNYFVFPGGGTQFKQGVSKYVDFIEKTIPEIQWGKNIRVILDVGCGVASFGGYLLDRNVMTMSFAPKDEHEAQIQFALERGIPATLSVIGTQKLTFPDNSFDLIHCARCRVHWEADGGKPLMELNRVMRPGGYFIWSATPVYRREERDAQVWKATTAITKAMCWKVIDRRMDPWGVGFVVYQKPTTSSCYQQRAEQNPRMCEEGQTSNISWYSPLDNCLTHLSEKATQWPLPWPQRRETTPLSLSDRQDPEQVFASDTKDWKTLVQEVYLTRLGIQWTKVRNVMDMNARYGSFAAALVDKPIWVMNIVPIHEEDTLPVIFDRGFIGHYHDWCESLSTYPRSYDLLHSAFMFKNLPERCEIIDVAVEMDRVIRPGGWVIVQDDKETLTRLSAIFISLHWTTNILEDKYLVGNKGFWRPVDGHIQR